MSRRLFDDDNQSLFSPLIDVVMGALGAFFTFLVVYMILFNQIAEAPPEPLQVLQGSVPPAIQGQNYMFTLPVTGGSGVRRFELLGELPKGLEFDPQSGTVYGVPEVSVDIESRIVNLLVEVSDDTGEVSYEMSITLMPVAIPFSPDQMPLVIAQTDKILKSGRVGEDYQETIGAMGGVQPYSWKIVEGELPPGLALENGYIVGVPEMSGTFPFRVEVSHTSGSFVYNGSTHSWAAARAEKPFEIEIVRPLKYSVQLPDGRVGDVYSGGIVIEGALPGEQVVWSGRIPGLRSSSDGRIWSGQPTVGGTYDLSFEIQENRNVLDKGTAQVIILPRRPQQSVGPAVFQAWVGEEVNLPIPYRGLVEPIRSTSVTSGTLPADLRLVGATIMGAPRDSGLSSFMVRITDATGESYEGQMTLRVGVRY